MNRLFSSTLVAAALAAPFAAHAQSAVPITFDMNGGGAGQSYVVDLLDWLPGNALAIGGNPSAGLSAGTTTQLLYQANLGNVSLGGAPVATSCLAGAQCFTAVAGFKEIVTSNTGGTVQFGFNDAPVLSATNFFYIYANTFGNNLAGTGFTTGTLVMSGHVTQVLSSNFSTTGATSTRLDNFGTDNYPGVGTLIGSGATDINVAIDFANAAYFPNFAAGEFQFSFFNNSQVTPFNQADPSALFSSNGIANGDTPHNVGPVNGVTQAVDYNFQFQADANQSFTRIAVPEPGSLALVGLALGALGMAGRRRTAKKSV